MLLCTKTLCVCVVGSWLWQGKQDSSIPRALLKPRTISKLRFYKTRSLETGIWIRKMFYFPRWLEHLSSSHGLIPFHWLIYVLDWLQEILKHTYAREEPGTCTSNSCQFSEFPVVVLILPNALRVKSWPALKLMMGGLPSSSTGWGFPWVGLKGICALIEFKVRARKKTPWLYKKSPSNSLAKSSCMAWCCPCCLLKEGAGSRGWAVLAALVPSWPYGKV